ncbi:MAG TPA: DUF58 domain-containing protein [Bacilli bacterium]
MSSYSAWFLFYISSFIGLYCLSIRLLSFRKVEAVRQISRNHMVAGDEVTVNLAITQHSYVPLGWITVKEEWVHQGTQKPYIHRKLYVPWLNKVFRYSYKITGLPRGQYHAHQIEITTGDLFGFLRKSKFLNVPMNFTVQPKPANHRFLFGDGLSRYDGDKAVRQMLLNTPQVSHVRNYLEGDAMNRIHWKMSSRLNDLMTKEMDTCFENHVIVLLNAAKGGMPTKAGLAPDAGFEQCVQAAAGLLQYGRQLPCRMELVCNSSGSQVVRLANRFETGPCNEFLTHVMNKGNAAFTPVVREEIQGLPSGSTLICVTSSLDDSLVKVFVERRRRNNPIHIMFIMGKAMPSEQELNIKQTLKLSGCNLHYIPAPENLREQVLAEVVDVSA